MRDGIRQQVERDLADGTVSLSRQEQQVRVKCAEEVQVHNVRVRGIAASVNATSDSLLCAPRGVVPRLRTTTLIETGHRLKSGTTTSW